MTTGVAAAAAAEKRPGASPQFSITLISHIFLFYVAEPRDTITVACVAPLFREALYRYSSRMWNNLAQLKFNFSSTRMSRPGFKRLVLTKQKPGHHKFNEIENCGSELAFVCPLTFESLRLSDEYLAKRRLQVQKKEERQEQKDGDDNDDINIRAVEDNDSDSRPVFFCDICSKSVHVCTNGKEFDDAGEKQRCVVLPSSEQMQQIEKHVARLVASNNSEKETLPRVSLSGPSRISIAVATTVAPGSVPAEQDPAARVIAHIARTCFTGSHDTVIEERCFTKSRVFSRQMLLAEDEQSSLQLSVTVVYIIPAKKTIRDPHHPASEDGALGLNSPITPLGGWSVIIAADPLAAELLSSASLSSQCNDSAAHSLDKLGRVLRLDHDVAPAATAAAASASVSAPSDETSEEPDLLSFEINGALSHLARRACDFIHGQRLQRMPVAQRPVAPRMGSRVYRPPPESLKVLNTR